MAENKKSFVLYTDQSGIFNKLTDEQAGALIKHIFSYCKDENPKGDFVTELAFESIMQSLKRDLKKYEIRGNRSRENGKLGGRPKNLDKPKEPTGLINNLDEPRKPVSVNDNVSVNVSNNIDWSRLLSKFNEITGKSSRVVPDKARNQILARIKEGYTKNDILKGIENCYKDSHHKETNHKYLTLEFISRPDKLEKFVNVTPIAKKKAPQYKDEWR